MMTFRNGSFDALNKSGGWLDPAGDQGDEFMPAIVVLCHGLAVIQRLLLSLRLGYWIRNRGVEYTARDFHFDVLLPRLLLS